VVAYDLARSDCRTRLPFRFGAVTVHDAPLLTVRVEVEVADTRGTHTGFASDLLVPAWFDKDPGKTPADNARDLTDAAHAAGRAATALPALPASDAVAAVTDAVHAPWPALAPQRLLAGFGAALLERALLDAVARAHGVSFFAALRSELYGIAAQIRRCLPPEPSTHITVRHTVGLLDPLTSTEVPALARRDALPYALEEDIAAYGLCLFKLKIGAGRDADRTRLLAIHAVLSQRAPADWRCSLDANEQYGDLDQLEALLCDLAGSPAGADLLARTLHLEQPLPRRDTFDAATAPAVRRIAQRVPLLVDEADVDAGAFPAAHALGYAGVSVKNCKGVLRAVTQHATCAQLRARGVAAFQSAEDLTNLPVLALQQDLATVQALGLTHAERNGHHYFAGLDHLPRLEAAAAAVRHADLYRAHGNGFALRIAGGQLAVGSLLCPGYGFASAIDFAARTAV
jgi:hypothetical protein